MGPREEVKLLPCPFCDGEAKEPFQHESLMWLVQCKSMCCERRAWTRSNAILDWNTRPDPVETKGLVPLVAEEVRKELWEAGGIFESGDDQIIADRLCAKFGTPQQAKALDNEKIVEAIQWTPIKLTNEGSWYMDYESAKSIVAKFSTPTQPQGKKLTAEKIFNIIICSPLGEECVLEAYHQSVMEVAQAIAKAQESA